MSPQLSGPPTLEGGSAEGTRSFLEQVAAVAQADFVGFMQIVERDGELVYGEAWGVGMKAATRLWRAHTDTPSLAPWDPRFVPVAKRNRFAAGSRPDRLEAQGAWGALYHPVGLFHTQRALVYDGLRFVGYLATHRCADQAAFTPAEVRALRRSEAHVHSLVAAWLSLEAGAPPGGANIVLRPDGRVDVACETGRAWLDEGRRRLLAGRARRAMAGADPAVFVVGQTQFRLVRLDGDGGERWLCMLRGVQLPEVSPLARLSPTQREVGEYAAAGATVAEIGRAMDRSEETVRTHLREVYRRLGIASRLELAELLA